MNTRGTSGRRRRSCPKPNGTMSSSPPSPLPIHPTASPSPSSLLLDVTFEQSVEVPSCLPDDLGELEELTAVERKISLLRDSDAAGDPADVPAASHTPLDGYRLVGASATENLISGLQCPACNGSDVRLNKIGKGSQAWFVVVCPECGDIAQAPHSSTVDHSRQGELAARICLASRECGIGYTKLTNLLAGINAPCTCHHFKTSEERCTTCQRKRGEKSRVKSQKRYAKPTD